MSNDKRWTSDSRHPVERSMDDPYLDDQYHDDRYVDNQYRGDQSRNDQYRDDGYTEASERKPTKRSFGRRKSAKLKPGEHGWERGVIESIATESLKEQRRARRWSVFFKALTFGYIAIAFLLASRNGAFDLSFSTPESHTAIVDINGTIAADTKANARRIVAGVEAAFENEGTAGVILRINSGGGSPVQSGRVYDEVRRIRAEHEDIRLYAVIGDVGASGAYYIAAAADKIYADKSSLVGSIGVRSGGFGFVDTIDKLGIERRLFTSGDNKAFLDPFAPVKQNEVEHMESLLGNIHEQFKTAVRDGRGDALKEDSDVFNGLIWTGEQALENGLVDGLGSEMTIAREIFAAEKLVNFTPRDGLLDQLADGVGVSITDRFVNLFLQTKIE